MRRLLVLLSVSTLLVASCAVQSDRESPTFSVPTSLVPNGPDDVGTGTCTVTIGGGRGARVSDVIEGSPAIDLLVTGDVITRFDDIDIHTASDLIAAVASSAIGAAVDITIERAGNSQTVQVTLAENPSNVGRPMLGVLVTTSEQRMELDDLAPAGPGFGGDAARVIALDGGFRLFDPLAIDWADLDQDSFTGAFMPIGGEIFRIEPKEDRSTEIVGAIGGTRVETRLGRWEPRTVLTTLEDLILLSAVATGSDGTTEEHAIVAVDPSTGASAWTWITDAQLDASIPVFGFRSPDGRRAVIGLTADGGLNPSLYVVLELADGTPTGFVPRGLPGGSIVLGWNDDDHLLTVVTAISDVAIVEPITGSVERTSLPLPDPPLGLWPVGDGSRVLVEDGSALVLMRLGSAERRLMTSGCSESKVSESGWAFD